ncbi:MAG: hypothetical protein MUF49_10930 [Oculatellaceae cyanobacterium Prado106]|jgi:Tfp pilus assembly protein PilP|nr:hypothetical protein [Oculatellaceae cyanobacterium Prado106]
MRKLSLVAISAVIALVVGGCSGGEGDTPVAQVEPAAAASPDPAAASSPSATDAAQPGAAQPNAAQPGQAQTGKKEGDATKPNANRSRARGIVPTDLINSTNPNQRLRAIRSERPDPFTVVALTPTVTVSEAARRQIAINNVTRIANPPRPTAPAFLAPPKPKPPESAPVEPIPEIPAFSAPENQALLAKNVSVTGVMQMGGVVYAIIDAPNESTSRYVQVGQRLSGGQIVVRRINYNGVDSSVVLEEGGSEVIRRVGDAPESAEAAQAQT